MSRFSKILLLVVAIGSLCAIGVALADQYGIDQTQQSTGGLLPTTVAGETTVTGVIGKIIGTLLSLLGIIFFLLVLYAGILWMTAMGSSEKIDKAKDLLQGAAIGLVLVLASYAIARFVFEGLAGAQPTSSSGQTSGGPSCTDLQGTCRSVADLQNDPLLCQNHLEQGVCPNEGICCK